MRNLMQTGNGNWAVDQARHSGGWVCFSFALIACLSSALFGQMNTADITGNITDASGALIPRATVTALQLAHTANAYGDFERCRAISVAAALA